MGTVAAWPPMATSAKDSTPQMAASTMQPTLDHCDAAEPIQRPRKPLIVAPSRGKKTAPTNMAGSALQGRDVLDLDGSGVAEVDHHDGEADRRLRRGDGEHEHGEDL